MSKENLEQFMKQIDSSEDLQSRIGDEIAGDDLVALGAEHGYEFSVEELSGLGELSDQELEGVAGGAAYIKRGRRFRVKGLTKNSFEPDIEQLPEDARD